MSYNYKLVLLPSNNTSCISKGKLIESLFYCPNGQRYADDAEDYQQLYITSEEPIQEDDWYIMDDKYVYRGGNYTSLDTFKCKKIIASTDNSLVDGIKYTKEFPIPSLVEEFILKYIKQYNEGQFMREITTSYNILKDLTIINP